MPKDEIDRSSPTQTMLTSSDEPPELMNGSGLPVTGMIPVTAAMFMNAWNPIVTVSAPASTRPNVSLVPMAMRMPA